MDEEISDFIKNHNKWRSRSISEPMDIYLEKMKDLEIKAIEFCSNKTSDELRKYLADKPVAYNYWIDADYDTLVKLVMNVYED